MSEVQVSTSTPRLLKTSKAPYASERTRSKSGGYTPITDLKQESSTTEVEDSLAEPPSLRERVTLPKSALLYLRLEDPFSNETSFLYILHHLRNTYSYNTSILFQQ